MNTIKSSKEISSIFQEGRRISTPELNLIIHETASQRDHQGRVAFIAGKKLGNAVWRNRAKRRMRSICFDIQSPFENYEILFVARAPINDVPYTQVINHVRSALLQAGIIHD